MPLSRPVPWRYPWDSRPRLSGRGPAPKPASSVKPALANKYWVPAMRAPKASTTLQRRS